MPKATPNTKAVGEKTQAIVLAELVNRDVPVLIPWGDNQRYDFVIDMDSRLLRLQVKTAWRFNGCIIFDTSNRASGAKARRDYRGAIDYFIVHCPDVGGFYMVHVEETGSRSCALRVAEPACRGLQKHIRWARDYDLDLVLQRLAA